MTVRAARYLPTPTGRAVGKGDEKVPVDGSTAHPEDRSGKPSEDSRDDHVDALGKPWKDRSHGDEHGVLSSLPEARPALAGSGHRAVAAARASAPLDLNWRSCRCW